MSRVMFAVLALLPVVAGCERPSERAARERQLAGRILRGALAYPQSSLIQVSTGEGAAELTLATTAPLSTVLAWYREALPLNGWELRSEAREPDGALALYAQQGERPLWIRLRENVGAPGTTYSLIGAQVAGDTIR